MAGRKKGTQVKRARRAALVPIGKRELAKVNKASQALVLEFRRIVFQQGKIGIGRWLENAGIATPDLPFLGLPGIILSSVDFEGWGLRGLAVPRGDLSNCIFIGAHLEMMVGTLCKFIGADFSGAQLGRSIFTGADLQNAKFTGADLSRASFVGANLHGANFTGAVLVGTVFTNANLKGAVFHESIIVGAKFSPGFVPEGARILQPAEDEQPS